MNQVHEMKVHVVEQSVGFRRIRHIIQECQKVPAGHTQVANDERCAKPILAWQEVEEDESGDVGQKTGEGHKVKIDQAIGHDKRSLAQNAIDTPPVCKAFLADRPGRQGVCVLVGKPGGIAQAHPLLSVQVQTASVGDPRAQAGM